MTDENPTRVWLVKELIALLGIDADMAKDDASLIDDLGCDSLDTVELTMAIEDEFKIEISDDDAEKIITPGTVGSVLAYIDERRAA